MQEESQTAGAEDVGVVHGEESVTTGPETDLTHPQTTADLVALQQSDIGHTTTIHQHELHSSALSDAFNGSLEETLQQTLNQQVTMCWAISNERIEEIYI